jgi:hypothetical protein
MRRMIKKQNGLTGIGLMFILAMIAGVVLIALRLFPLYNEKFQIVSAMNSVVARPNATKFTTKKAGKAFLTALAVTNINRFDDNNVKESLVVLKPRKKGEPRMLHLHYESRNKFFADIQFLLVFDKKIPLTGPSIDG